MEYALGLTTAGTYASGPTSTVHVTAGTKKPGDIIQFVYGLTNSSVANGSLSFITSNVSTFMTPISTVNFVRVDASAGWLTTADAGGQVVMTAQLQRGATQIGSPTAAGPGGAFTINLYGSIFV